MGKKPDLHGAIENLQDHFYALREAFVALTHTLLQQGQLDLNNLHSQMKSAEQCLLDNGETAAAEALAAFAETTIADLTLARRGYVCDEQAQQD